MSAAACASANGGGASPGPLPPLSSPQPMAGQDWFFHDENYDLTLAYGTPESDDVRIGLRCQGGSGIVNLYRDVPNSAPREIHIESGGDTERLAATSEPSELSGGQYLMAEASAALPVFQRFRRVGWLAVWDGNERHAYAPHPGSEGGIERFFAGCG